MDLWSQQVTTTSFATVIGAPAEIASAILVLHFQ